MVPIGVRQESRRSANLPYLSLWIHGTSFLRVRQVIGIACLFLVAYLRSLEQCHGNPSLNSVRVACMHPC